MQQPEYPYRYGELFEVYEGVSNRNKCASNSSRVGETIIDYISK